MQFGDKVAIIVNETGDYPAFNDIYLEKGIYEGIVITEENQETNTVSVRWMHGKVMNTIIYPTKDIYSWNCIRNYSIWIGVTCRCRFMSYQLDTNFEMAVCFCSNARNPDTQHEGNCNENNCPLRYSNIEIEKISKFYEDFESHRIAR